MEVDTWINDLVLFINIAIMILVISPAIKNNHKWRIFGSMAVLFAMEMVLHIRTDVYANLYVNHTLALSILESFETALVMLAIGYAHFRALDWCENRWPYKSHEKAQKDG